MTNTLIAGTVLDRFLDPLTNCLTAEVAKRIVELRPEPTVQTRLDELADKANDGQLSAIERSEYEELIEGIDLLGILKAKARAWLARQS
jgi:hypothetical protein